MLQVLMDKLNLTPILLVIPKELRNGKNLVSIIHSNFPILDKIQTRDP